MTNPSVILKIQSHVERVDEIKLDKPEEGLQMAVALGSYATKAVDKHPELAKAATRVQIGMLERMAEPDARYPLVYEHDDESRVMLAGGLLTQGGDVTDLESVAVLGAVREFLPDTTINVQAQQ